MNKPDWKDAPDWAQWLAMDEPGEDCEFWVWFECLPIYVSGGWLMDGGRWMQTFHAASRDIDPAATLEQRP